MDAKHRLDVVEPVRERKMGVSGGRPCVTCGVIVHWRVEKFCLGQPKRFGHRIYCIRHQAQFPVQSPTA